MCVVDDRVRESLDTEMSAWREGKVLPLDLPALRRVSFAADDLRAGAEKVDGAWRSAGRDIPASVAEALGGGVTRAEVKSFYPRRAGKAAKEKPVATLELLIEGEIPARVVSFFEAPPGVAGFLAEATGRPEPMLVEKSVLDDLRHQAAALRDAATGKPNGKANATKAAGKTAALPTPGALREGRAGPEEVAGQLFFGIPGDERTGSFGSSASRRMPIARARSSALRSSVASLERRSVSFSLSGLRALLLGRAEERARGQDQLQVELARELGVLSERPDEGGAAEPRLREVGAPDVGLLEHGPVELRADELGEAQVAGREVGVLGLDSEEVRAREVGSHGVRAREPGSLHVRAAEVRPRELHLRHDAALEVRLREVGAREIGLREVRPAEVRARSVGLDEARAREDREAHAWRPQVDLVEEGAREIGLLEMRAQEARVPEVRAVGARLPHHGVGEVRALRHDALEVGLRKVGAREIGPVRLGAAEYGALELGSLERRAGELRVPEEGEREVRLVEPPVPVGHAVEDRLGEVGALEDAAVQLRAAEVRVEETAEGKVGRGEIGPVQLGARHVHGGHGRFPHAGASQRRVPEVRPDERDALEDEVVEVRLREVGPVELRTVQGSAGEVGAREVRAFEVARLEFRAGEVGAGEVLPREVDAAEARLR